MNIATKEDVRELLNTDTMDRYTLETLLNYLKNEDVEPVACASALKTMIDAIGELADLLEKGARVMRNIGSGDIANRLVNIGTKSLEIHNDLNSAFAEAGSNPAYADFKKASMFIIGRIEKRLGDMDNIQKEMAAISTRL